MSAGGKRRWALLFSGAIVFSFSHLDFPQIPKSPRGGKGFVERIEKARELLRNAGELIEGNKERKALVVLEEAGKDIDKLIEDIVIHLKRPRPPFDETMGPGLRKMIEDKRPYIKKGAVSIVLARVVRSRDSMSLVRKSRVTPAAVKMLVSFLPKYLDVDGEIEKVYWIGDKDYFGRKVPRRDLLRGRKIFLKAKGGKASTGITEGKEYWFVIGPPSTVNLDMALAGGGRSMVVFFEERK